MNNGDGGSIQNAVPHGIEVGVWGVASIIAFCYEDISPSKDKAAQQGLRLLQMILSAYTHYDLRLAFESLRSVEQNGQIREMRDAWTKSM